MRFLPHPRLRLAFLGAGSALLALVLLEVLLRLFLPQPLVFDTAAVWEPVAGLGWQQRPDLDLWVNTGERDVRLLTDALRHRVGAVGPPNGDVKILAVGDSMVEALQVDYEQIMTTLLAGSLSRRLNRRVEVVNAGVGGWDPNQYLIATRQELANVHYDLVLIFVYLENDLVDERVEAFPPTSALNPPRLALWRDTLGQTVVKSEMLLQAFLRRHSHLFVFLQNYRELLRIRSGIRTRHLLTNILRSRAASPDWRVTVEILQDIDKVGAEHGAPVICVLLPPPHYFDSRALATYLGALRIDASEVDVGQPARLLTAELKARGLGAFDATPALKAAFEGGQAELYGRIDKHLAPAGHQVMAGFLEPIVLQQLALPHAAE